jgi:hypothetical protein
VCRVRIELPRSAPSETPDEAVIAGDDAIDLCIEVDSPLFSALDLPQIYRHFFSNTK